MDFRRGAQTVHARHTDVQHSHIGPVELGQFHRLVTVAGLGDDVDVGCGGQHGPYALADHGLVVGDQDPDHWETTCLRTSPFARKHRR